MTLKGTAIPLVGLHSYLSATTGPTFIARRAGRRQARKATTANNNGAAIKVAGSLAVTPNNRPDKILVNQRAANRPMPIPQTANDMP